MASTIKVNNIQNQCGANIINESANTITIGASGDTISLAAGASQTGFGRTGTVDWDTTAKTSAFTAVSGVGYFVNTTSGAVTVTLPAGSAGSIVSFKDYANTWNTNNVTLTPNGTDKINGTNASAVLEIQDQSVTLVYVDSTKGWRAVQDSTSDVTGGSFISATGGTVTECGNYKIHTFTGPGTFTVCSVASCAPDNEISYIVVAGGGGGGTIRGGGGGAGGFRESKSGVDCYSASPLEGATPITVTASPYPISVGGGGSGSTSPNNLPTTRNGTSGGSSTFSTVTSAGGGVGGHNTPPSIVNGTTGGSGGGAGGQGGATGGAGNTPPTNPSQGNTGGNDTRPGSPPGEGGGGGGGATAVGVNSVSANAGCGGAGATTSISASPVAYAGGGGGGTTSNAGACAGAGGTGGGGTGGDGNTFNGTNGTTNTGGGGGGTGQTLSPNTGGNGGSGIVIIRYKFQ
jgi:hypothetical protein